MRRCVACLLLVLSCGAAAAQTADTSLVLLPDYFQKSFDGAAAKPLKPFVPKPKLMKAIKASIGLDGLPDIITRGVPPPPERPDPPGTAAAYAEAPVAPVRPGAVSDGAQPALVPAVRMGTAVPVQPQAPPAAIVPPGAVTHAFVPLPVRRPGGIDDRMSLNPADNPSQPETKVAMLGAFPGAGVAINSLARMTSEPAIVKGACSVPQPYRLMAIGPGSRTTLEPAAIVDNAMISGLVRWEAGMQLAAQKDLGESVVAIKVAASYD